MKPKLQNFSCHGLEWQKFKAFTNLHVYCQSNEYLLNKSFDDADIDWKLKPGKYRDVFRTQSNIYYKVFLRK